MGTGGGGVHVPGGSAGGLGEGPAPGSIGVDGGKAGAVGL